ERPLPRHCDTEPCGFASKNTAFRPTLRHLKPLGPLRPPDMERAVLFRRKVRSMEIALAQLSTTFLKQEPPCRACGYDATWLLKMEKLETLFCERCLVDALFDAVNFATAPAT